MWIPPMGYRCAVSRRVRRIMDAKRARLRGVAGVAPHLAAVALAVLISMRAVAAPQWVPVGTDDTSMAQRARIFALAIDPAVPERVYAAAHNELFVSVDGALRQ